MVKILVESSGQQHKYKYSVKFGLLICAWCGEDAQMYIIICLICLNEEMSNVEKITQMYTIICLICLSEKMMD